MRKSRLTLKFWRRNFSVAKVSLGYSCVPHRQVERNMLARPISSPVVTLLSKSPGASRRTQSLLRSLFGLKPIELTRKEEAGEVEDCLDCIFPSFLRGRNRWDSVASRCPASGTVLHLLSLSGVSDPDTSIDARTKNFPSALSLVSVTQGLAVGDNCTGKDAAASVQESRRVLALRVQEANTTALAIKIVLDNALGRQIDASHLLGSGSLPVLDLPLDDFDDTAYPSSHMWEDPEEGASESFRLREIVLPYFDDATYSDGSSLLSHFGQSALSRPLMGIYQWPKNDVVFRPLPAAKEDLTLPPPSFVFRCDSLDNAQTVIENSGATCAKVGFSGHDRRGQLIVRHELLAGLDFRMCEATKLSSSFAEAQESLLAGSLDDLQNINVMAEGGKRTSADSDSPGRSDAMNGLGDCWVEFRANLRNPSGFWKRKSLVPLKKSHRTQSKRIAKAPDIPFE